MNMATGPSKTRNTMRFCQDLMGVQVQVKKNVPKTKIMIDFFLNCAKC